MSLELFPTYPKIRTDQLSNIDWNSIGVLRQMGILNNPDLNAITQTGIYIIATNTATNAPIRPVNTLAGSILLVFNYGGTNITQVVMNGRMMSRRAWTSGFGWSTWITVLNDTTEVNTNTSITLGTTYTPLATFNMSGNFEGSGVVRATIHGRVVINPNIVTNVHARIRVGSVVRSVSTAADVLGTATLNLSFAQRLFATDSVTLEARADGGGVALPSVEEGNGVSLTLIF